MSSMGTECRNSPTSSVKVLNQDALQSPHVDEVYGKGSLAGGVQELWGVALPQSQELVPLSDLGPREGPSKRRSANSATAGPCSAVVVLRLCHRLTGQRKCHPMRDLKLNQQEQTRTQVLNSVLECQLSIAQAAETMGLSQRHTKRILAAYRRDGPAALARRNRGRRPHNAVPEAAAAAVVKLASNNYAGVNHTHLTELLREREGIDLSRPTVRRILAKAGMGSPRSRRSPQHRFRRRRMPREGPVRQWGIPWPCTATGIRPSSTMPARHRCLSNPPSSLR